MEIAKIAGKGFGATVTGVSLTDMDDGEFAEIKAAFLQHGFLLFPGQFMDEEQNVTFGERFGPLEFGGAPMSNLRRGEEGLKDDVLDIESQLMRTNVGNETWHTDSTYKPVSSKCAMLSAVIVPDVGGQTELADARAGFAALDDATKDRIRNLSAFHSTQFSQANDLGDFPPNQPDDAYGSIYHGEAYLRPLVKVHPETGDENLFIGRHAFGIPGLSRDESRALLASLLETIISDESRTYLHHWQPGDTLIWDNRAVLHRARPYDYDEPRYLIATRVAGDESELAYYPTDPEAEAGRQALREELDILRDEAADRRYRATSATH